MATQADQIREFVISRFIEPARKKGEARLQIRAGDVHDQMNLRGRLPNVVQVLAGQKLQVSAGVRLVGQRGPKQGPNTVFLFEVGARSEPAVTKQPVPRRATTTLTPADLAAKRSALVRLMNGLEGVRHDREKAGARVRRLVREGLIPSEIGQFIFSIFEGRNVVDFEQRKLTERQAAAVMAAWDAVAEWTLSRGIELDRL